MKKRSILCVGLALVMTLAPMAAFAGNDTAKKLTLADAKAQMMNTVQGEILEMGNMGDQIALTSSVEGLSAIRDAKDAVQQLYQYKAVADATGAAILDSQISMIESSMTGVSKNDITRTKNYAKSVIDSNKKARVNALDLQAIEMYYTLKSAEEGLTIVKESYDVAKTIYDQTQKKYKLGTVSKLDLLKADLDLAEAKDTLTSTENGVKQARMGFNILFGYDLMQQVTLTDEIAVPTLPAVSVEDAVAAALKNRNEIKEANYKMECAEKAFAGYSAYPRSSAKYLTGKASYLAAKASCSMVPITVEQSVRTQYDTMHQYYDSLQTSEKNVANAKETLRLVQLQYNSGMTTYTTVQQVRMAYESAQMSLASAKLNYALAVEKFNMATDVGTVAAGF